MNSTKLKALFNAFPTPCVLLSPDGARFTILAVNDAYCQATNTQACDLIDKGLFEVFPDNPNDPETNGEAKVRASLDLVIDTRNSHKMDVQKYDIRSQSAKEFEERHWSTENSPVLNDYGEVEFILHTPTDVTAQVLIEKQAKTTRLALLKNEEHYRSLFDHHPDAVYSFDLEGNFLSANPGAAKLAECSIEELLAITFLPLIPPEDSARVLEHFKKACTGEIQNYNTGLITTKGNRLMLDVTNLPIIVNEEIIGVYGIAKDITQIKKTENEVIEQKEKFQSLVQTIDGIFWEVDAQTCVYTFISQQVEQILGYTAQEWMEEPDSWQNYIHEEDRDEAINFCQTKTMAGEDHRYEYRMITAHGSIVWLQDIVTVIKDNGKPHLLRGLTVDVTKQKLADQEAKRSREQLQQIMDSSLDIICTIDEEGRFANVSAASETIWGYRPQELTGRKYIDFVLPEDASNSIMVASEIMNGVPVTMFENRYIHKGGRVVPILWSSRWDEKDKLMYCIAKDATEKKRSEKAFEIEIQRFHDLYAQAPSCMGIIKGPDYVYELANPLYLQLIDKKDIIGKTVKEVLPELEWQGIFELLDTVYQTGQTFSANEMLFQFDLQGTGELSDSYLNLIYQAHRNHEGSIDGIFFFVVDVTEQVVSRKKIEQSQRDYRDVIQNLPVAVYTTDPEGKIMLYNKAAVNLWGREPVLGRDRWCGSWKAFWPDHSPMSLEEGPIAKTLRDGSMVRNVEIIVERPDGVLHHVLPYPSPLLNAEGKLTGAVNVLIDISESKKSRLEKDLLNRISEIFNAGDSFNASLTATMEEICRYAGKKYAETWMCDLENGEINLSAEFSAHKQSLNQFRRNKMPIGEGLPGQCWLKKEPVFLDNIQNNATAGLGEFARQNNLVTARAIPLVFKEKVIAVFVFYSDHKIGINRAVSLSQNILLHLASEIQRKRGEEEFNLLFSTSEDLLYIAGIDGLLKKLNPAFIRTFGYDEKDLLGIPFLNLVYPDDLERSLDVFQKIAQGHSISNFEFRLLSKTGEIIWLNVTTTTLPGNALFFCIAKDQTEKKKAEEQLIRYSNRISTILESIADAFLTVDHNWNVVYWNKEAERMFRTASDNIIGNNFWQLFENAESESNLYHSLKQAMGNKRPVVFEKHFKAYGFWAEVSIFPSDEGLSVYVKDIDVRKNTYLKLVKTEMEVRSFARQLNQVLEDERSRIAREIHDEFGQQLAGIKMSLSSFKRKKQDDPTFENNVSEMLAEVDNCMQSLRKFATELRPGILDTLGLVPSIEWLVKEFMKKTGIACQFETHVQDQKFDETLSICFFRICQEALTNILKHAFAADVSVRIEQVGNSLLLRIQDNGRGIVHEELENPFSMGLLGMRERANIIGARLQIISSNKGTKIELTAHINAQ